MKANPRPKFALALAAATAMLFATSCSEPRVIPAPTPTPTPTLPPLPPPSPVAGWQDMPVTPGDWTWGMESGLSVARFAGGQLVLSCDRARRVVTMSRPATAPGPVILTVQTSNVLRPLTATPREGASPAIAFDIPADDSLLDAMAFSRGRFVVETAGLPTLVVPSWTEVSRVVEDCR